MGRYIKLRRSDMEPFVDGRTQGYKYQITAYESSEMPLEVFMFQRFPATHEVAERDEFVSITSPGDIEEYPINAPISTAVTFFRVSTVELIFRNVELAEELWLSVLEDIKELIWTLNAMDVLTLTEEVLIGEEGSSS